MGDNCGGIKRHTLIDQHGMVFRVKERGHHDLFAFEILRRQQSRILPGHDDGGRMLKNSAQHDKRFALLPFDEHRRRHHRILGLIAQEYL